MGWSLTINNLVDYEGFDPTVVQNLESQHPMYAADAENLLIAARLADLASCTISGGRTPDPHRPNQEVVQLGLIGFTEAQDFQGAMRATILTGPDKNEG